jgi:uncharacterized protein YdeI (YjbR/CyaY-like superfamily)
MNPKVDWFFLKDTPWKKEYNALREIILETDLREELKWGQPCYTYEKKNIVLIHGFNEYCALLFHKGALLKDPKKVLIQQTEHVQSARQMRFTSVTGIKKQKKIIQAYVYEAVKVEESGAKVELKKTSEFPMPEELKNRFNKDKALKNAFNDLTPGRQRGYLLYFSQAKQSKTREERIDKYRSLIMEGKGLSDEMVAKRKEKIGR